MTVGLRPYPEYKHSGVPWLGEVPEHWAVSALKHACSGSALYGANVASSQYCGEGVRFLRTTDIGDDGKLKPDGVYVTSELAADYMLCDGDLLLSRSGTIGRSFLYQCELHGPCAYAGYLVRFVPKRCLVPKFIFYFTKTASFSDFVQLHAISSTIDNVNGDKFARMPVPLPPTSEQVTAVRCLELMNGRITRFIRNRRRLIALLNEQKQAIINQAVTRGLDPNVRLKPSGVDWLGDIPEHWEMRRIKEICRLSYGDSLPIGLRGSGSVCVFGSNGRVGEHFEANTTGPCLVIGRKGSFGKVNYSADPVFAIDTTFFVDTRFTQVDLRWLFYALQWARLDAISKDAAVPGLSRNDAYVTLLPYCGTDEQDAIARYLDSRLHSLNQLQSAVSMQIDLIREFRTRLISDVVTGKVDVRGVAAQLEDEPIEPEDLSNDIDNGDVPEDDELVLVEEAADADE